VLPGTLPIALTTVHKLPAGEAGTVSRGRKWEEIAGWAAGADVRWGRGTPGTAPLGRARERLQARGTYNGRMEGATPETGARSWLRCYCCWSQDLEVRVH
jgi:hypothetical protein